MKPPKTIEREALKQYLLRDYKVLKDMISGTTDENTLLMLEGSILELTKIWESFMGNELLLAPKKPLTN